MMEKVSIRHTSKEDQGFLVSCLQDQETLLGFPLRGASQELKAATEYWMAFADWQSSLTLLLNNIPCGIGTLFLEPYSKVNHHSEIGMIIAKPWRNRGLGTLLLAALFEYAKKEFSFEFLNLLVYAHNPALSLYNRMGFKEFGRHSKWIKEGGVYKTCLFMECPMKRFNQTNPLDLPKRTVPLPWEGEK